MSRAGSDLPATVRRRRLALTLGVAALVVAVDQVTKSIAAHELADRSVHLVGPFSLVLEYNSGVAFSIGVGLTVPIVIVAVVIVGLLVSFTRHLPSRAAAVAVGLVLGGALGNLSDRLFRGHGGAVVDFLHSTFWPTFNVADSCIVCGAILLALVLLRHPPPAPAAAGRGGPDDGAAAASPPDAGREPAP